MKPMVVLSITVAVFRLAFFSEAANASDPPAEAPQVVVLKLDDVTAYDGVRDDSPVHPGWQRVTDFLRDADIKASFGIIGFSLEEDNKAYFDWIKNLHDSGLIEFWNHGYRNREASDNAGEFEGSFEEQMAALERTQSLKSKGCVFITPSEYMALATDEGNKYDADWTSLFNGKNLDGWGVKCLPKDNDKRDYWRVVEGAITAEVPPGSKHNYIWLLNEGEYGDFELRMKVQTYASSTGNSGVQVRSRYDDKAGWLDGPQVDINPPGPWRNGFIYDETREAKVWLWPDVGGPANAKPGHAPEGWKWFHADERDVWNDVRIVCDGTRIKTTTNGVTVADYDGAGRLDDEAHRRHVVGLTGRIGLQIHPGKQMLIRFKDIEVRELE